MRAFSLGSSTKPEVPDQAANKRVGEQVRKRLAANKAIYTLPTDKADIFAMGDFMSPQECRKMISATMPSGQTRRFLKGIILSTPGTAC